jgi:hypothetical protein
MFTTLYRCARTAARHENGPAAQSRLANPAQLAGLIFVDGSTPSSSSSICSVFFPAHTELFPSGSARPVLFRASPASEGKAPFDPCIQASLLQLHDDQEFQLAIVEKEIDVEVFPVELNTLLASYKRKSRTHLKEKGLQFAQDGILKIRL